MEVALIIYMCSAIQKTCLDPYVWPDRFYDKYGCMIEGYRESEKKMNEYMKSPEGILMIGCGGVGLFLLAAMIQSPW